VKEREPYRNRFTCVSEDVPYRPERRTRRPVVGGAQTAVVVGPAGEEIHTDVSGRVWRRWGPTSRSRWGARRR
jgi:type VI secretion system secreted protein VgrG